MMLKSTMMMSFAGTLFAVAAGYAYLAKHRRPSLASEGLRDFARASEPVPDSGEESRLPPLTLENGFEESSGDRYQEGEITTVFDSDISDFSSSDEPELEVSFEGIEGELDEGEVALLERGESYDAVALDGLASEWLSRATESRGTMPVRSRMSTLPDAAQDSGEDEDYVAELEDVIAHTLGESHETQTPATPSASRG